MSERPICPSTGKKCYSQSDALSAAAALRSKGFMPSARSTRAYRCPDWKSHANVGHYHVGSTVKRSRR